MFEYELDGEVLQFTQEDVDNRAKEKGLTTEEYLAQHPEVKSVDVEKTKDVAETGAPAASETTAPAAPVDTELFSEDFSLDVPETLELKPGAFGKYNLEKKRVEKIERNNRLFNYQQQNKDSYVVDPNITNVASILQETEFAEIASVSDDIILGIKSGDQEGVNEIIRSLDPKTEADVRRNLLAQGVTIKDEFGKDVNSSQDLPPGILLGEIAIEGGKGGEGTPEAVAEVDNSIGGIIGRKVSSISPESQSTKSAWASEYFRMDMFEKWQEDNKGSTRSRSQNIDALRKNYEEDLKEYLGDKYELFRSIYTNKPLLEPGLNTIRYEPDEVEDVSSLDLKTLIDNKTTSQKEIDQAMSVARKEIAQVTLEEYAGSGDKSVVKQLELLQGLKVYEKNVGQATYDAAFKDLLNNINPIIIKREFENGVQNNDPETFMELFKLAQATDVLEEKGWAGSYTTPQMYLKKLIGKMSANMVKDLQGKVTLDLKDADKKTELVAGSFEKINSLQSDLVRKINSLNDSPDKTEEQERELIDLVGQYNANQKYLDKVDINSIGEAYSNQMQNLNFQLSLINDQYEKGKLGEAEYIEALGKNYDFFDKTAAMLDTQLFGGYTSLYNRITNPGSNTSTKSLRLREESMRKNMSDKIMYTKQNWRASLESSIAESMSSTVAGLSLFIPVVGQSVGMSSFFAMSAGGKIKEIEAERERAETLLDPSNLFNIDRQIANTTDRQKLYALNKQKQNATNVLQQNWWMETGVGVLNGVAEVGTEYLFGAGRIARNFAAWSKVGANASIARKAWGSVKAVGISLPGELFQETFVQTTGNIFDRQFLNRDVGLFDGINKQFVIDVGIGTLMLGTGGGSLNTYKHVRNAFQTRNEKKQNKIKLQEIEQVDAEIKKIDPLNVERRIELEDKRSELVLDLLKADKKSVQKLENLSVQEIEQASELDRKRHNALKVIHQYANSGEYGVNMTSSDKKILDDAKQQYNDLTDQIEDITGKENAEFEKAYDEYVEQARRSGIKVNERKSKADVVYEMGMASFARSTAKVLAREGGVEYVEVSKDDLTDEFYASVQETHGPDLDIEQFKRDAEGNDAAKYVRGGNGTVYVFTDNINSSIVLGTNIQGQIAAVSPIHEIFHHQNAKSGILNKDGDVIQSAEEAITGLQSLMKSKFESGEVTEEAYEEFKNRVELYRTSEGVDHEEMVNLVNDLQTIGAVKRSDWNALFGFKNYLNTLLGKTRFGKNIPNLINFNKTEDVYNYISNFNTKALEGKVMSGTLAKEEEEKTKQKSARIEKDGFADSVIAEELGLTRQTRDIVETNDQIYQDIVKRSEKENKPLKELVTQKDKDTLVTNNMPRVMALATQAARAAQNLTLDESLKIKDVNEWASEYSLKLVELANSWDPAKNDSFGAYMNQLLPKKYSGILDKLKAKVETTSAERDEAGTTAYNNVIDEGPTQDEILDGKIKPKKAKGVTLVNDMVGLSDNIRPNKSLDAIKEAETQEERQEAENKYQQDLLNTPLYKLVAKLNPKLTPSQLKLKPLMKELQKGDLRPVFDMVVKEFGLDPKKVAKGATMPQGEIRAAQRFISNNLDLIIGSLPEGFDSNFKATGVQNVLLNAFYNQRSVRSGNKAGNLVWVKKPVNSILKDKAAAMGVFGLTEAGIPNIVKKDANIAPPIQAVARWTASNIVNQTVREIESNDLSPEAEAKRNALNDGKSKMLSSKLAISLDKTDPALGIEFRSMLAELGKALDKVNTLDRASVRSAVEEVYDDILTKPQITQFVADLTKPKTGILARYDLLDKNYKEVKAELFDLKEFVEMEAAMTEAAALNQISKILGIDIDRAELLRDEKTVNRVRKTVITGFATELENSGLSDIEIVKFVLAIKDMHASAGNIGKAELSTNGNPGGEVSSRVGGRERRQSGQITEGNADFFALIKNGSQKVYDLMLIENNAVSRKRLSKEYGVEFKNYSEKSAEVLKEIESGTYDLEGRENQAKFNQDVTLRVLEFVKNKIDEGVLNKGDALVVVGAFGSNMESPSRKGAYAAYVAENANTFKNPGKDLAYDHMKPHNVMMNQVVNAVFNTKNTKKKQEQIKEAFNDYVVGIIPEAFDTLLTTMGLQFNMQTGYDPKATGYSGVLGRLYNDRTLGGDGVVAVRSLETGKVFGESFVRASNLLNDNVLERNEKKKLSKVISRARMRSSKSIGMSTFDFDETLIIDGENFIIAKKGDDVQRISSGNWPLQGPKLDADGYDFDFTDFVNVRGGVDGPLLQKMKNQIKKYGTQNVFVLTARPAESATAIHGWLKTKGINIPFKNITGLGNSTGDAKAAWFLDKYAEGYNDMYFVDDAMPNVEAVQHVFNQLDVKGKSVQAKMKSSKVNIEFNEMLERTKGIGAEKIFSRIGAQKRGKNVGRFNFFVPPSADDFAGLLRYFVGRGEQGNKDLEFFKKVLIDPFARADRDMKEARQAILEDYKALRKEFPKVAKKLGKMINNSGFTFDNAIRVYLWDKAGFDIPGLSKRDVSFLTNKIKTDQDLKNYADVVGQISKQTEGYIEPSEYWSVESIAADLQNVVNKQGRKKFLAEWKENVDVIFSPENLNKIEAAYGSNFREALENILWRMENGTNRAKGMGRLEGAWNNWVNNSVGAIMFFNARSAVLQTLSTVNFINFEDNNIFAAAKAFANQKQYWKDFSFLFNSDFLKQRRAGLQTNINEAEIANAVAGAANKAKAALQYLLKIGFTPTQIADSFAIATGGATYYRNRVKKYIKEGMSQADAESQAMLDFQEIAEETQQSARPDRISQQQASSLGRIILAFANTPMQYARLIKKASVDLVKGRGDWRSNVSRIVYYGAVQNIIFSSLQSAIFALAFDDEEPEEDEINTKVQRTLNGMIDSLLRGSGLAGAVVATIKNTVNRFIQESEKKSRADYGNVLVEALNVSPPIGSKARKLYNATKTYKYNREVMGEMSTFDLENPIWDAIGNVVSATTNLPLDRGFRKIDNIKEALNQDNETWQRIAVALGWDQWSLGIDSRKEVDEAKKQIKEKKKEEKKKSQQRCTKIKSDGARCKIMVNKPKTRCHYHD